MEIEELLNKNRALLTTRDENANKGSYGKLLLIAGSRGMAGACFLSAYAAFKTGIGMVRIYGPECNRVVLQTLIPEAMYSVSDPDGGNRPGSSPDLDELKDCLDWADYVTAGPGLSTRPGAAAVIKALFTDEFKALLRSKKMLVLDADALNIIKELDLSPGALSERTVITPHVGEMSRLLGMSAGEIKARPEEAAGYYRDKHGVTVVLKDAETVVAGRDGVLRISSGCGAMAKAGSGDVLTGFIAGVTACLKGNLDEAVPAAVWLHGRAGTLAAAEKGCHSLLARDIADYAAAAMRDLS